MTTTTKAMAACQTCGEGFFWALHQVWWKRGVERKGSSVRPEQHNRMRAMSAAAV